MEAVERTFQDIMASERRVGSKTGVFSNWPQILPVVRCGGRPENIEASGVLHCRGVLVFKLTTNKKLCDSFSGNFANTILQISEGR